MSIPRLAARGIPPGLSLYLDLVRFLAAVSVVLYHTWDKYFPSSHVKWPGHEAVVVFFVLSGYVIAHAASAPGMTFATYVQHRAARILPVAYSALFVGLAACLLIPSLRPPGGPWSSALANALFLAQSGPLGMDAPLNPPFWSLNYEVWYYVLFGIWMFAPAGKRWPLVMLAALVAGPKILMLLPVWVFGVLLYRAMPALRPGAAWCCLLLSLAAAALLTWLNVSDILRTWLYATVPGAWRVHFSSQFLYDIPLGVVVALHFAAAAALAPVFERLRGWQKPIRYLAGCTFTLYVFHSPLQELFRQVPVLRASAGLFYAAMAVCILALAALTERRVKHYRALAAWLGARLTRGHAPSGDDMNHPSPGTGTEMPNYAHPVQPQRNTMGGPACTDGSAEPAPKY